MAKKPVPRKSKPAPAKKPAAAPSGRTDETMTIRKISNGYVVRQSWTTGSGEKTKFHERETFTKTKPVVKL